MTQHFSNPEIAADAGSAEALIVDLRKLLTEADPDKQSRLRQILIEEEDKLSKDREQLEKSARWVRDGKKRVERLKTIMSTRKNSADRSLLSVMELTQTLFENFNRRLLNEYPYSVKLHNEVVGVCETLEDARRRAQQFADGNPEVFVTVVDARRGRTETFYQELA